MAKINRTGIHARIIQKVEALRKEHDSLTARLDLVARLLEEYEGLLAPELHTAEDPQVTLNVGSRTAARQERKSAMIAFLKERGEAQTGEIIEAMKAALPHANPTRAQVQDVLQNEPEFTSLKKGIWGLTPTPTTANATAKVTGTVLRPVHDLKEILG